MTSGENPLRAGPGDVVAVRLPPGPRWPGVVAGLWESGAALFPLDDRLPEPEARALLDLVRPTRVVDAGGATVVTDGAPADPGTGLVVATSGTGGRPKAVELPREAVESAVRASARTLGANADDGWLCCLPLGHVGGILLPLRGAILGAPTVVQPGFDPDLFESDRSSAFVSVVPTMLRRLLDAAADLERFRAILVGGAALSPGLAERAAEAGARVVETYGLTETCGGVVYDGRPLEGTEIAVAADGEIRLHTPALMSGYRHDPAATAAVFTTDGWLLTGDVGTLDPDGRLRIEGRLDELILTGGEKVWPEEVESALLAHPGVADAAVAGRPHPEWGQQVVAFVVRADIGAPPRLDELRAFASERIARFKAPRELILVDEIPRTASGKVRRYRLPA